MPLAGQGEALAGFLRPRMHRQALVSRPDLHGAQPLAHLHRGAYPLPVNAVAEALPTDEPVPRYLTVLPEVGRQHSSFRQLPQVRLLLSQHLSGHLVGCTVGPPVGYAVAPLKGLPVQIGIIGEAYAGPQVAPDVLYRLNP